MDSIKKRWEYIRQFGMTTSFASERVKYHLTGIQWDQIKGDILHKIHLQLKKIMSPNLDSLDADDSFWHFLDGHGEVEGARKPQSLVQCHHHKHLAGCHHIVKEHTGDEGGKNHDFAYSEKWCQIHSPKVGTSQNLGNFLSGKESRKLF